MEVEYTNRRRDSLVYRTGDSLNKYLSIFWSRIQEHYESSAPRNDMLKLSPLDLHRKWKSEPTEMSSAIRRISPSVVSVSYFTDVQRTVDCSGIIIDWDDAHGQATILTSAKLMRSPAKRGDYYIVVRLANGKILLAEEHFVDYYHNIAIFKVSSDVKLKPAELDSPPLETLEGVEVVALGRNFHNCKLSESSGLIRLDYPYFGCEFLSSSTCSSTQASEGGPLITKTGHVCGINFFDDHQYVHPLPTTSVINSCKKKWSSNGIVVQPWFGLSVIDISELPRDELETAPVCYGNSSSVGNLVYEGSPADKVGVRPGDSIVALRGFTVSSASQYTEALSVVFDELHPYCPGQTPDIMLFVKGNTGSKAVHAEILRVDDRRFCYCWLGVPSFMTPLIGSQTYRACCIGESTNFLVDEDFILYSGY
ncbi:hypothetical protein POM88_002178 [Heracleum sosnowskyi]|uniref:PDZ domain-containing protein n=1 Tax=Heracleum sosnowskyi TaxID=360622 RepID=A0AAD8NCB9_9APIA|nr:hypothetical protein POM88_002178 [Heracleum sosnowskyi]